jgi:hypothetical protein
MKIDVKKAISLAIQYGPLLASLFKEAKGVVKPKPKPKPST